MLRLNTRLFRKSTMQLPQLIKMKLPPIFLSPISFILFVKPPHLFLLIHLVHFLCAQKVFYMQSPDECSIFK
jgi:hypothetical protein